MGMLLALATAVTTVAEGESLGDVIMHHVVDSHEVELPGYMWHLPSWAPVQIGPFLIDFSPTKHLFFLLLTAVIVAAVMLWTARRARREGPDRVPRGLPGVVEALVLYIRDNIVVANIGHGGERFAPFIVTLFMFIWVANLLGLLPWGASPTANLSVTAALALTSLVAIEVAGMRALGLKGYSRTIFFWPHDMPLPLRVLMFVIMTPVELLGKFTKPFALAMRLFANMVAGKFVILSLIGLIFIGAPIAGFVLPWLAPVLMSVAFMVLKLFVAILQAYVFSMLTAVFIGLIRHAH